MQQEQAQLRRRAAHRHVNGFDDMVHNTSDEANDCCIFKQQQSCHRRCDTNDTTAARMSDTTTWSARTAAAAHQYNRAAGEGVCGVTTKRSLSESSTDEFYKCNEAVNCAQLLQNKMWRNELVMNAQSMNAQPQRKYSCTAAATARTPSSKYNRISDAVDVLIRVALVLVFAKLETVPSFKRKIQLEELWQYKNPRMPDIVSVRALLAYAIFGPFLTTLLVLILTRDRRDFRAASWAWTLILGLNGLATSLLKITVGRPRPDYFYRCFPDGVMLLNNASNAPNVIDLFNCTGNLHDINEGRKSFPSGHSSFAFAAFGFIAYYVGAKLHAFNARGRGQTWRLCIGITPLIAATLVAISRTCDYHHHWQDVFVGGLIGLCVSYFVYRQYFPSIFALHCQRAYARGSAANLLQHAYMPRMRCNGNNIAHVGDGDALVAATTIEDDDLKTATKAECSPLIASDFSH